MVKAIENTLSYTLLSDVSFWYVFSECVGVRVDDICP